MGKKCLFLTILLLGFQLVFIQPSWPAELNENNKLLASALRDLQQTIIEKIEYDADTTATAFADAENIDRDLRLKDIFRTPLVIIEETINTIGSLVNARRLAENAQQVFDSSQTNLQIVSGIMTISTLKQVGEDLQLAIDGPSYCSNIEEMLDKAYRRSSTRLQKSLIKFNPTAYKNIINLYLYAQYEPGPLRIPHKSTDVTRRNLEIVSGTYKIERSIRERFRVLRNKLEDNPLSSDSALETINQIQKIKRAIMASKGSYQKLRYETYLKDETDNYIPNTVDLALGTIAELEKFRRIALANLDKDLMIERAITISRAVRAGIQATTLHTHTKYKSPKTGKILGEVQKWSLVPSMTEVLISKYFDTNAREQVNMIPQEMMMTLPLELSNVWMVADDTASYIEYLIKTEKEQPPKEVSRAIPAEIRLTDKSVIKGEIQQEKIKIKTKYGEMDIPVENFVSIIGQLIELKDGTTLKGNFAEKTLGVKTDYGKLKVQTKDIDFIIFAEEEKPPTKEPLPPTEKKIPIPKSWGIYLFANGKLIILKENPTFKPPVPRGDRKLWWETTLLKALSGIDVLDSNAYILWYRKTPPTSFDKPGLGLFMFKYNDEQRHWEPDREVKFEAKHVGKSRFEQIGDMYLLIPSAPLAPGTYLLMVQDNFISWIYDGFDFTVNFEEYKQEVPEISALNTVKQYIKAGQSADLKKLAVLGCKSEGPYLTREDVKNWNLDYFNYIKEVIREEESKIDPDLKLVVVREEKQGEKTFRTCLVFKTSRGYKTYVSPEVYVFFEYPTNKIENMKRAAWFYASNKTNFDKAIWLAGKAIESNPDDAEAKYTLGYVYAQKGDYERAVSQYKEAMMPILKDAFEYLPIGSPGKAATAVALAKLGDNSGVLLLKETLEKKTYGIGQLKGIPLKDKVNAALALAKLGDKSAIPTLKEGFGHVIFLCRGQAGFISTDDVDIAVALAKLGDRSGILSLKRLATQKTHRDRIYVAVGLAKLGDRSSISLLKKALDGTYGYINPLTTIEAATALVKLGDESSISVLKKTWESRFPPSSAQEVEAAVVLARWGDKTVIPRLKKLLNHHDFDDRVTAALALTELFLEDPRLTYEIEKFEKKLKIQVPEHHRSGMSYYNQGKYDEAIEEFKKVIRVRPDNTIAQLYADAYKYLVRCHWHTQKFDEALEESKRWVKIQPDKADAHYALGDSYYFKEMYDNAIEQFKKTIQIRPNDAGAHSMLAESYVWKGMYDKAIEEFKKVLKIQPNDKGKIHSRLGWCYYRKKMYDEAIVEYKKVLQTDYYSPASAHYSLGRCYYEKNMYDEAVTEVNKSLELLKTKETGKRTERFRKQVEEFLQKLKAEKQQKPPKAEEKVHETAKKEETKMRHVTARVSNADDKAVMYVNGQEAISVTWGTGPGGKSIGHRPGDSGWTDITLYLKVGDNVLRFWVWNKAVCCGVSATFEVQVDGILAISRNFKKQDSTAGVKYNETVTLSIPKSR